jgi:hypothetical protein
MKATRLTDEDLLVDPEMVDTDNNKSFEQRFRANACIMEGCSGHKRIDTLYENTSVMWVQNPREGSTPTPVSMNGMMFPHRRL